MSETPKFKVTIDNISIEVPAGTTILNAARMIGGDVTPPAMCYYSKLKDSGGKCRTCLVEVSKGSEKDPRPMPKLVASCRTTVMDGMEVKNITSEKVIDARKGVVEFLLINHPLDCPVCDQAGECDLQNLSYEHGQENTRYEFKRRTYKERLDMGYRSCLLVTNWHRRFLQDPQVVSRPNGCCDKAAEKLDLRLPRTPALELRRRRTPTQRQLSVSSDLHRLQLEERRGHQLHHRIHLQLADQEHHCLLHTHHNCRYQTRQTDSGVGSRPPHPPHRPRLCHAQFRTERCNRPCISQAGR